VPALKQDRICLFTLSDDGFLSAQEPAEVTTVEAPVRVTWCSIRTSSMVTASMS
jgi:6-phosphogluconolactonase (cycloisomerase 2 family)